MIPQFATTGLMKLVVESKQSWKRVKLLEKHGSAAGKLSALLREMEHGIEDVLVETVDDPGVDEATPTSVMVSTASPSNTQQQSRWSSLTWSTNWSPPPARAAPGMQPDFLPAQLEIVAGLNKPPDLKNTGVVDFGFEWTISPESTILFGWRYILISRSLNCSQSVSECGVYSFT